MAAEIEADPAGEQLIDTGQLLQGAAVGESDPGAARLEEVRQADAGAPGTNHDNLLVPVVCRHQRNFRVERPIRARMILMIQKRTMIFGSGHPLSSK